MFAKYCCRALLLAIAVLSSAGAQSFLPDEVAALIKKHRVKPSQVGIIIRRLSDDAVLVEHQAEKAFNPASLVKLFTAGMAVDVLGPNYRWKTTVAVDGAIKDGVLDGDLYFIGGGDPYLTVERFLFLLNDLRSRGIRVIRGDVVIDDSVFALPVHDERAFDGAPLKPYNVGAGGMVVNFKATKIVFFPQGNSVGVYIDPPNKNLTVINKLRLSKGRCRNWRRNLREQYLGDDDSGKIILSGNYSRRCKEQAFYVSMLSHPAYVAGVFGALWERLGGEWEGNWRVGKAADDLAVISELESSSLAEVMAAMNKFSNNVIARNVFLSLAGDPSPQTKSAAKQAMREWLAGIGIAEVAVSNGSGLSREARASARQFDLLLSFLWRHAYRADFVASLPIFGMDGTLKKRAKHNKSLIGQGRLKTGSLANVKSLGGYFRDAQGRPHVVVFLAKGVAGSRAKALQNDLLKWARTVH